MAPSNGSSVRRQFREILDHEMKSIDATYIFEYRKQMEAIDEPQRINLLIGMLLQRLSGETATTNEAKKQAAAIIYLLKHDCKFGRHLQWQMEIGDRLERYRQA